MCQHIGALFGHKSPVARARELFKPSTDSASLLVDIEKKFFRFEFEVFWGKRHKYGCFCVILAIFACSVPVGYFWTQNLVEN